MILKKNIIIFFMIIITILPTDLWSACDSEYESEMGQDFFDQVTTNAGNRNPEFICAGSFVGWVNGVSASIRANNAYSALVPSYGSTYSGISWGGGSHIDSDGVEWSHRGVYVVNYSTNEWYFVYANYTNDDTVPCPTAPDSDGDGIPDPDDPWPDDPETHMIKPITYIYYDGEHVGTIYQTDEGDYICTGTCYSYDEINNNDSITSEFIPYGSWTEPSVGSDLGSGTSAQNPFTDISGSSIGDNNGDISNDPTAPNMQNGDTSDGSDLDTEKLGKIVNNTEKITHNQQIQSDYQRSILSELERLNLNTEIGNSIGTSTGQDISTVNAGDVKEGVEDALQTTELDQSNAIDSMGNTDIEYQNAQNTIVGDASLENDAPLEFRQKTDITTKLNDLIANNPISAIINNTGVTVSGATDSLSWNYNGNEIVMSVGRFDSSLSAFGQILLGMATLSGMLLVFRGF